MPLGIQLPGNADGGSSALGDLGGNAVHVGDAGNSLFEDYIASPARRLQAVAVKPFELIHGAYDEVKGAGHRAAEFIAKADEAAAKAATGFANWTKWIVVGIVAVAVIYALGLVSSVVPRRPAQ